jgi:hypothetical protein
MMTPGVAPRPGLASTAAQAVAVELERLSASRPLVIGLLHAHEIPNAAAVIAGAKRALGPVLCVATVPERIPPSLRDLAPAIRLGPVSGPMLREMIATLLPLAAEVADAVGERADGNAGSALEMVRRLAEDRQLIPSEGRWELRPSADLAAVLSPRSRQRLASLAAPDREALRLLQGMGVTTLEGWTDACRAANVDDAERALERLARTGWVDADGSVLRLAEGLRDAR